MKVSSTPEWVILTGDEDAREEICRSVYRKTSFRAAWCLRRLLSDPSADVRVGALGALAYRTDLHDRFLPTVKTLTGDADPNVRARALEFLFQHDDRIGSHWRDQTAQALRNDRFRSRHPQLLSFYLTERSEHGDKAAAAWVLGLVASHQIQDLDALQPLLDNPEVIQPHRETLVEMLDRAIDAEKAFVLAALTAVDGQMRGTQPRDWRLRMQAVDPELTRQQPVQRFMTEAEWAHRLQPNFEIAREQDVLCLLLGEGAGGDHFWRRHELTSVDVGKAFISFTLAEAGLYQVWIRCWFGDKCGNHSLLHIDDRWLRWRHAGDDDRNDILRRWHWKMLETNVSLDAGRHTLRLTAADDGLLYDKLALMPAGERFDPEAPPPLDPLYDPTIPSMISFTPETQSQRRGTTQTVSVWVRRNSPRLDTGTLCVTVPQPFHIEGENLRPLRFAPGSPLARVTVDLALPEDAVGGEVTVRAVFAANGRDVASSSFILGITPDWWTTGPLAPDNPRCATLKAGPRLSADDLAEGWAPYPAAGYDRYRRLTFESAYGEAQNKIIFLYTELLVTEDVELTSYLTIDDCGFVFVDGEKVAGRHEPGVGEGWLLAQPCHLSKGRHQVLAWVYQADFPEPTGAEAGRHTPNHWNLKWLLRESLHQPCPALKTVPVGLANHPRP